MARNVGMTGAHPTRCFTCGEPTADPRALNRLSDGRVCPACAERALEAQPSLLPRAPQEPAESCSPLTFVRGLGPEDELSWAEEDGPEPA